jgi:hypothetical protein
MARASAASGQKTARTAPDASMRIVVLTGKDSFMRVERSRQLQAALEPALACASGGSGRSALNWPHAQEWRGAARSVLEDLQ